MMLDTQSVEWTKEEVRALRLRLGWSRSDLARRLNCSQDDIQSWEEGTAKVGSSAHHDLILVRFHADACSEEVKFTPACENEMDRTDLSQIEFARVKADFE